MTVKLKVDNIVEELLHIGKDERPCSENTWRQVAEGSNALRTHSGKSKRKVSKPLERKLLRLIQVLNCLIELQRR
jgi:hypothetical protein